MTVLTDSTSSRSCTDLCMISFKSSKKCFHGFSFCLGCNDLWSEHTHNACPNHGGIKHHHLNELSTQNGEVYDLDYSFSPSNPTEFVSRELLSQNIYSENDFECDSECLFALNIVRACMCRHGKVKCHGCAFIWEGNAQCPNCNIRSPNSIFDDDSDSDETVGLDETHDSIIVISSDEEPSVEIAEADSTSSN